LEFLGVSLGLLQLCFESLSLHLLSVVVQLKELFLPLDFFFYREELRNIFKVAGLRIQVELIEDSIGACRHWAEGNVCSIGGSANSLLA